METTRTVIKKGGPLLQEDLVGYPGHKDYKEHLRKTFGLALEEYVSVEQRVLQIER